MILLFMDYCFHWSADTHCYSALQKIPIQVYVKLISTGENFGGKRSPVEAHHYRESVSEVKLLKTKRLGTETAFFIVSLYCL